MATKKEIKNWLDHSGYTLEDMEKFWQEGIEYSQVCRVVNKSGKTWRSLNINTIETLPNIKERALNRRELEKKEALKKKEELEKKEKEKLYYKEHFFELMFNKINNGEELTEDEVRELIERGETCSIDEGENRRWSKTVTHIIELFGRYYHVEYEEGLTELQENTYYEQPYEVKKKTYKKTIVVDVVDWLPVEKM